MPAHTFPKFLIQPFFKKVGGVWGETPKGSEEEVKNNTKLFPKFLVQPFFKKVGGVWGETPYTIK